MSELNAEKMAAELSKRGNDWADKDAAYFAFEETTKTVLSECIADVEETLIGHNSSAFGIVAVKPRSMTDKETEARRSEKFKKHLDDKVAARKAMNRAKVNYDTYKAYMELRRSEEATNRAAMTLR